MSKGDQIIYNGHLYWFVMEITLSNGGTLVALRQAHWPPEHHVLVDKRKVIVDVPFAA